MQTSLKLRASLSVTKSTARARTCVVSRSTGWADPSALAAEKTMFGEDMGARDATAGELESNFSDKVIGNWDTEHLIKAPDAIRQHLGLSANKCSANPTKLTDRDTELMRQQVPGWRMATNDAGVPCIRSMDTGWLPMMLVSLASGGLSHNDFIVASKINDLDLSDLAAPKKKKFWA
eukprot:gene16974-23245_t